jgi:hypothetical protein
MSSKTIKATNATKYGKYIMTEPHAPFDLVPIPGVSAEEMEQRRKAELPNIRVNSNLNKEVSLDFAFVPVAKPDEPGYKGHPSHKHDVEEYIWFHGGDPQNVMDFGAEIEITLGEGKNAEKHIIDKSSVVYIPKGLAHLPIKFKKVDKPIFWGHILLTNTYLETRL